MPSPTTIDAETGALIETETTSLTASLRTGIDTVNEHWRAAEHHHQQSCAHLIMAGHQLIQLRKEVGHGNWMPLFTDAAKRLKGSNYESSRNFDFSVDWANRLIKMAEASKKQIPQLADLPFDSNLRDWSATDLQTLRESVAKRADGETFQQLSWDWGLAKLPQGHGLVGKGNRAGGPKKTDGDDDVDAALELERQDAIGNANKITKALDEYIRFDHHLHLTKDEAEVFSHSLKVTIDELKKVNRN